MIDMNDVRVESYPLGGYTGQLGLGRMGIKVTHLPTDKVACCSTERSQSLNLKKALKLLEEYIK